MLCNFTKKIDWPKFHISEGLFCQSRPTLIRKFKHERSHIWPRKFKSWSIAYSVLEGRFKVSQHSCNYTTSRFDILCKSTSQKLPYCNKTEKKSLKTWEFSSFVRINCLKHPKVYEEEAVGEKSGRLELILFMMPGKLGKNGSSLISRERAWMKYDFMKVKKYAKPFVPSKSFVVLKSR